MADRLPSTQTALHKDTLNVLNAARVAAPFVSIILFVVVFVFRTVLKSPEEPSPPATPTLGPGGRPLPPRRKSARGVKQSLESSVFSPATKKLINYLSILILVTFLGNAAVIVLQTLVYRQEHWWCGQSTIVCRVKFPHSLQHGLIVRQIYVTASFFVWTILLLSLFDISPSPNVAHFSAWAISIPVELVILGASAALYSGPHYEPTIGDPTGGRYRESITFWEGLNVAVNFIRFATLLALFFAYATVKISCRRRQSWDHTDSSTVEDQAPLLANGVHGEHANGSLNGHTYGATSQKRPKSKEQEQDPWAKPKEVPPVNWYQYLKGFTVFFPYLWPAKSTRLQMVALVCFSIVVLMRFINVSVPILTGWIVNTLAGDYGQVGVPWFYISAYVVLRWLQGNGGLLNAIRASLWIPVDQYAYRELSVATFQHVHGLSLDFHLSKRTGEVLSALNKGGSINTFLETIIFNLGPMIFDLFVAIVYLAIKFDVYIPLVVGFVTFFYVYITIRMAQWRQEVRRAMTDASREEFAVKNDSLVSYETVKYFNAEKYEFERYRDAVRKYQAAESKVVVTLQMMNVAQHSCFMLGLLVACFIEAYQVAQGQQKVGDFVVLITMMAQLQAPLNFFGTFFRSMQSALINSERMLELFKEQPTVVDSPLATTLPPPGEGHINFDEVTFAYDTRKAALNGLSFECRPGTTTALVGESGGGKSTVFRLLFRFYNPEKGRICIDGSDVKDVTIDSVRQQIGVVPQDTVLFNESLMYNLKYANQDVSDEDVYEACRAASIHDKIMAFPDGYQTKVGERGLRLSGGEKQRVAIARTILKDPRIILLDEATAALDTETEEHIQGAFSRLQTGRTMLVIAHRLSTITNADQILVLNEGRVIEGGRHNELLSLDGKYASMWRKQIRAQEAAVEAEKLRQRAEAIMEAGGIDSQSHSEDEGSRSSRHEDTENTPEKSKSKKAMFLTPAEAAERRPHPS